MIPSKTISKAILAVSMSVLAASVSLSLRAAESVSLEEALSVCQDKPNARLKYECEKTIKEDFAVSRLKESSAQYVVGPVTFYYPGSKVEISGSGTPLLNLKFLVENTGSDQNVTLMCTGPAVCNYDITDGHKTYKYSATNFTSGQTVLKPDQAKEIEFLFGPAIGYGSYEDFEFDPSREYRFRISEPWGKQSIPLGLK